MVFRPARRVVSLKFCFTPESPEDFKPPNSEQSGESAALQKWPCWWCLIVKNHKRNQNNYNYRTDGRTWKWYRHEVATDMTKPMEHLVTLDVQLLQLPGLQFKKCCQGWSVFGPDAECRSKFDPLKSWKLIAWLLAGLGALHHGTNIFEVRHLNLKWDPILVRRASFRVLKGVLWHLEIPWDTWYILVLHDWYELVCQVEAGYAVAHITLLGVGLYVDVALTQWNGVFWTALQNHQSKQFYRVLAAIRQSRLVIVRDLHYLPAFPAIFSLTHSYWYYWLHVELQAYFGISWSSLVWRALLGPTMITWMACGSADLFSRSLGRSRQPSWDGLSGQYKYNINTTFEPPRVKSRLSMLKPMTTSRDVLCLNVGDSRSLKVAFACPWSFDTALQPALGRGRCYVHDETKLGTGGCSRGRTNQCLNAINFCFLST